MFELSVVKLLKKKICRATSKFLFNDAKELLDSTRIYLDEMVQTTEHLGDPGNWSDAPNRVHWLHEARKDAKCLERITILATEFSCQCNPVECMCEPTSEVNGDPNYKCRMCGENLVFGEAFWVDSKNFCICSICDDILFDKLYPEFSAKKKIDQVVEDAVWWIKGDRPQFANALALINQAAQWAEIASTFSNAKR